jgi:enamine deaminase RidA (YjgF/YER057c/UK114 family)
MAKIEAKLKEMGIELTKRRIKSPWIVACKQAGNLIFVSGHGTDTLRGKLGRELTTEQGVEAAREVMISILASLKAYLDDLDKIKNIVKVLGMVNGTPDFVDQPAVINGASQLLVELYGKEAGLHARSAVGMNSLPGGIPVEIEMIVEI